LLDKGGSIEGGSIVYIAPMYIEKVPNRNSPPAILLREGWREGNKTRKRTILCPVVEKASKAKAELSAMPEMDDHWTREPTIPSAKAIGWMEIPRGEDTLIFHCFIPSRLLQNITLAAHVGKIRFVSIVGTKLKWRKGTISSIDFSEPEKRRNSVPNALPFSFRHHSSCFLLGHILGTISPYPIEKRRLSRDFLSPRPSLVFDDRVLPPTRNSSPRPSSLPFLFLHPSQGARRYGTPFFLTQNYVQLYSVLTQNRIPVIS